MKRCIAILLISIMMIVQGTMAFAADDVPENGYEMVEIEDIGGDAITTSASDIATYKLYLADIITSIVKVSSTQVSIRAEAVCSEKVKSITVTYILQKWNGSTWVDVASKTATAYDAYSAHKSYTISGLGTGRYRCKASAKATGYSGYAETLTGYSASINL